MSDSLFETDLHLAGPWRVPAQMLAEQDIGGRTSIHDDATAQKVGFQGGTIEGPTHFSQFVPLGHAIFGDEWFESGCLSAHYQTAALEGEELQAQAGPLAAGASNIHGQMQKRDGTPVLSCTLSLGPDHGETELDALLARLRPAEQFVIMQDLEIGMKGAEIERVSMDFDQHMGNLYPFTLSQKLAAITEPCRWYTTDGAKDSPWGRPIIPLEMISVLGQYTTAKARFPIRPAIGLFVNQEIKLVRGPLFVGDEYLLEREIVALSESRRAESMWVRTTFRDAKTEEVVATQLLNSASMKASYEGYEAEREALLASA
jgi:hypothetical protein